MNAYLIAAGILATTITAAAAENAPPIPKTKVSADVDVIGDGRIMTNREATIVKGWNTIHAANCVAGNVSNKPTVMLYSTQAEGVTLTGPSTLPTIQSVMIAQCATGNWVSFFVTKVNGKGFTYNALQSWDFK